jgi:hypothetical protein
MTKLNKVRAQLARGDFEFSRHAFRRAVERNISAAEIADAGAFAEVIEDYPHDKYSPSALLLGFTKDGRPLHFRVSFGGARNPKSLPSMSLTRTSGSNPGDGGSYV